MTVADGAATLKGPTRISSADGRYVLLLEGGVDGDSLLAAFRTAGRACFGPLTGAFVCAVLDTVARRLTLARDHFGMKSLFYARTGEGLAFASTIGVLLPALPARAADPQALRDFLVDGVTDHAPYTMFAHVHAVPPAHVVEIDLARPLRVDPVPYWQPGLTHESDVSLAHAAERCRELFLESVDRSGADWTGAMLSGGTDTSAIVMALRHERGPATAIHTFSYIGADGAVSEEPWIDVVNKAAHAVPHKLWLHPEEWAADIDSLVELQGEPFGTIAVAAQHRLYRLAASASLEALLSGVGADELMGGHVSARLASLMRRGSWVTAARLARRGTRWVRVLAQAAAMALPERVTTMTARAVRRRPWIDWHWLQSRGAPPGAPWWAGASEYGVLRSMLWRAVRQGLPAVLRYEDRNAAAAGLSVRFPFLTPTLAELVLALPEEHVVADDGRGKAIFRAAMRGLVPDAVLDRKDKIGFSVPVQSWALKLPTVAGLLELVQQIPAVDRRGVAPLLAAIRGRRTLPLRESFVVWRLVGLAAWAQRFNVTFV